jgi:acetyl esterase
MNLEPNAEQLVALLREANRPPIWTQSPQEARSAARSWKAPFDPSPMYEVVDRQAGEVPIRIYKPTKKAEGCIVYLHGGGWVIGSIDQSDTLAREIAAGTNCAVVSVGYRLAPEHPFPAAVEDAWQSVLWANANLADLAGANRRLILMGDSAGGNLAAVCSNLAAERGGPHIALQILAYPITDCDFGTETYRSFADGPILTRNSMQWFWDHYLADPAQRSDARASPLRAASLAGAPPAFVLTAENDPLRAEGEAYAAALQAAGVQTRLKRYLGQLHGFLAAVGMFEGGAEAMRDVCCAIREIIEAGNVSG